jgi:hypothetical protein
VDDGSTDGTIEYLRTVRDPRVRPLLLPHSGNVAHVRNAGARTALGEYLAFLDSDDLWDPDKLAVQIPEVRRAGASWSYTGYDHIDSLGRVIPPKSGRFAILSGNIADRILTAEVAAYIGTVVVSRTMFDSLGQFDEDPGIMEDYDLTLRVAASQPVLAIPQTLTHVREHDGRVTHGHPDPYGRMFRVYVKFAASTRDTSLRRLARTRAATHLAAAGSASLAQRHVGQALKHFGGAVRLGANPRMLLSAIRRGVKPAALLLVALMCTGCGGKHLSLAQYAAVLRLQNMTTQPLVVSVVDGRNNVRLGTVTPGRTAEFGIPAVSFGDKDFVYFRADTETTACQTPTPFKATRNTSVAFVVRPSHLSMDVAGDARTPCIVAPG